MKKQVIKLNLKKAAGDSDLEDDGAGNGW